MIDIIEKPRFRITGAAPWRSTPASYSKAASRFGGAMALWRRKNRYTQSQTLSRVHKTWRVDEEVTQKNNRLREEPTPEDPSKEGVSGWQPASSGAPYLVLLARPSKSLRTTNSGDRATSSRRRARSKAQSMHNQHGKQSDRAGQTQAFLGGGGVE